MSRDWRLYWQDILTSCRRIISYTAGMDQAALVADQRTYDAVVRNLEIIGEAVKGLPQEARDLAPTVEWRKVAGLRDIIAHAYFSLNDDLLWDAISNKLPMLLVAMEAAPSDHTSTGQGAADC